MGKLDTICGKKLTQVFNKGGSVAKAPVTAGCALQTENMSVRVRPDYTFESRENIERSL